MAIMACDGQVSVGARPMTSAHDSARGHFAQIRYLDVQPVGVPEEARIETLDRDDDQLLACPEETLLGGAALVRTAVSPNPETMSKAMPPGE